MEGKKEDRLGEIILEVHQGRHLIIVTGIAIHGDVHSGLMVSKHCYALSDKSVHAGTVISSWSGIPGLVNESAYIKSFNNKLKHPDNGRQTATATPPSTEEASALSD
ncbi:hypothetical protein C8J56DRAFT_1051270 [Mycena floridula]|nr:hypothetical protein C8J56DRAFT_1051270 [Mycena floridula]